MANKSIKTLLAFAAVSASATTAFAAGYEKSIMWGGRSSGVAGIATPYITGSQALYFNPAGLANDKAGHEVSFNISPTWSQFKGPINNANEQVTSTQQMTTPFGLIYNGTLNDKWGFGVGGFVVGGSRALYENVALGNGTLGAFSETAEVKTDLSITEISAGLGYKVTPDLKLGLGWRVSMVSAGFSLVNRVSGGAAIANIKATDLKETDMTGVRFGAQYRATERTKLGFTYRSKINFEAEGNVGGRAIGSGVAPTSSIPSASASARSEFPQQATLGAQHDYDMWRSFLEYSWTNYGAVKDVVLTSNNTSSVVQQDWKDQHNVRVAGEYVADWPVRVGYGWTSQVTSSDFARASFTPPGSAHTLTLGTGHLFNVMEMPMQFDVGAEYTFGMAEGNPNGSAAGTNTGDFRKGDYAASAYALHLGLAYAF